MLMLGEAFVWNMNYLLGFYVSHRLNDATFLEIDRVLYSWFFEQDLAIKGMFPLVQHATTFSLLENAYMMLFPEILLLLLLTVREGSERVLGYLLRLFASYFIAMFIFVIIPIVGPPIYMPTTMNEAYGKTLTFTIMKNLANEYERLQVGLPLINGFGSFIAFPSLHVSISALIQVLLKPYPTLFWTFLPINVLLILSTVLLGCHYFLDLPAGLLLPILVDRLLHVCPVAEKSSLE
jgi:membrane-associated phospholipid phosphatase